MNKKLLLAVISVMAGHNVFASSLTLGDLKNTTITLSGDATTINISKGGVKMQVSRPIFIDAETGTKTYKMVTVQNLSLINEIGYNDAGEAYSSQSLVYNNVCSTENGCQIFEGTKKLEGKEAEAVIEQYMDNDNMSLVTQVGLPSKEKFMEVKKSHEEIPTIVSTLGNPFSGDVVGIKIN